MPPSLPLPRSLGARPRPGAFDGSPHFHDGAFHNRRPDTSGVPTESRASLIRDFALKGRSGRPTGPVPLATPDLPADADTCAATWLGHATVLLEVGGHWVLADPVWSERVSPSGQVGPRRHHPVPLALRDLPQLSAVLISHDHYDHLDTRTIEWLTRHQSMVYVVPLGVGAHLRRWDVPPERIVELDWGQEHQIGSLRLACAEAQHFSGRFLTNNTTLWSSWIVATDEARVFFGGDTGHHDGFTSIGESEGPFDLTVLPIGAYDRRWRSIHMDPAEALHAHATLRGQVLLPIHWATFDLAFHAWADPIEWLVREAGDTTLALPRPGERFRILDDLPANPWWRP
ncbi:MBL fold metallo-hydrolase [Nocardioides sp. AE5]|uniref:MBL fold metallo-hydrolase n=1 Tax=Nocardioides sp. AE5 TaxID=2962573 RepID=UPI0028814EC0|nr:MBL fold metallo-hydrolase [Nocardioides sp. AE5]MDT0202228.1 MBL fold metallo-hydrolase [Nocardioides sp. AE5]